MDVIGIDTIDLLPAGWGLTAGNRKSTLTVSGALPIRCLDSAR